MPAYHSQFTNPPQIVGNMALLPLCTNFKGPAPKDTTGESDIIEEALYYFKANIFFRNYEIKCPNKNSGLKEMVNLALSQNIPIPGEQGFPMNALFKAPVDKVEEVVDMFYETPIHGKKSAAIRFQLLIQIVHPLTLKIA